MVADGKINGHAGRRSRGLLAADVNRFCLKYVAGEFVLEEGKFLTPYNLGKVMREIDGDSITPSSGAIYNVFCLWQEIGYASFRREPFAFLDYTEKGRDLGLDRFMEAHASRE